MASAGAASHFITSPYIAADLDVNESFHIHPVSWKILW